MPKASSILEGEPDAALEAYLDAEAEANVRAGRVVSNEVVACKARQRRKNTHTSYLGGS
jgi:hypothetical protein